MIRRPISKPLHAESGMTLIELVIVIVIYGTLLSIAMPQINRTRLMASLDSAQRAVVTTVQRARWLSINQGQQYNLFIPTGGATVQIRDGSNNVVSSMDLTGYSVTAAPAGSALALSPRGFSTSSQTITLTQSNLPATRTVSFDTLGKVTVN